MIPKKLWNGWTVAALIAIAATVYLLILYPWTMRWGATDAELGMSLPGDELVPDVGSQSTRAVAIHAPAAEVWKWVVQLGQERAGFYSNDWLENLTLADIHNADEIRPEWQARQQGDHVLGAGGPVYGQSNYWTIQEYVEGESLYLWGSIAVLPVDAHNSRLLTRTRNAPTTWSADLIGRLSYDWIHFVMERGMLLGIKARAEGTSESNAVLAALAGFGWLAAALGTLAYLLLRRSMWTLLPLAYAAMILIITHDMSSAMAGLLWWGIIVAGFVGCGRAWWKWLALLVALVILVFVLAPLPYIAFGMLFLLAVLAAAVPLLLQRTRRGVVPVLQAKS